jgi:predicted RNA-binding Zn-ribbon protein involved in translation (DUF1610 family)
MNTEEVQKLCASCGADVTHQEHHKSRNGKYYCPTCQQARRGASHDEPDAGGLRRCVFCGAEVRRRERHRNRYGEYVCRSCHAQGKRWSRRKSAERSLRHGAAGLWRVGRVLLYVVLAVVALVVAYAVLGKIIQTVTPTAG